MANTASAKKRIRSSARKREHNRVYRSAARTYIKRARTLLAAGEVGEAEAMANIAVVTLDKAAAKGILHKRNVARRKSRLMRAIASAKETAA